MKTHPKFQALIKRIDRIYKKTGDLILIGRMLDAYKGPTIEEVKK